MSEVDPNTTLNNEDHWANDIINDDTPAPHAEAMRGFETQADMNAAYLGGLDKNWRDDFAGEDDKFKSQLERYSTPADLGNAFREQRSTISSGSYKQAPAEGASDDDIKAYREANGIPVESDGYLENLPEGVVLGDDDKEIFKNFAGAMHDMNVEPAVMHKVIEWYNGFAESEQDSLADMDSSNNQETEDQLRQDWGTDYRANINLIGAHIEGTFGKEAAESLLNARDPSGRAIMNIPGILEGFANVSRQMNPIAQLAPQTNRTAVETLDEEIAGFEKLMRTDRKAYNADEKGQARYRELLQIRIDHQQRKSA